MVNNMVSFDEIKTKYEILNFLRYKLNYLDPRSRITETTTPFTATASQEYFVLSSTTMSYVKSVTINTVVQKIDVDYEIQWSGTNIGSVKLTTIATGGETVSIVWGSIATGKANFIHPDYPRLAIGKEEYPRVGFKMFGSVKPGGMGGGVDMAWVHLTTISLKVVDEMGNAFIDNATKVAKDLIMANTKNFTNFKFISPNTKGSYDITEDASNNILGKITDFEIPDSYQTVTFE